MTDTMRNDLRRLNQAVNCLFMVSATLIGSIGFVQAQDTASVRLGDMTPPVFSISPSIDQPIADPGDRVEVDVYLYGYGDITDNRFFVHIPRDLIDGEVSVRSFKFISGPNHPYPKPMWPPEEHRMANRFVSQFHRHYFTVNDIGIIHASANFGDEQKQYAPLTLSFKAAASASPGDHDIAIRLAYIGPDGGGVAEATTRLTIRSYAQRNATFLTALIGILAVAAPLLAPKFPSRYRLLAWSVAVALTIVILLTLLRR